MKKISKEQSKLLGEIINDLANAEQQLTSAIEAFNEVLSDHAEKIRGKLDAYNDACRNAEALRDECQGDAENYFNEKSEKWQESDKGAEYQTWIDSFRDLDLSEIEIEIPDPIELPDFSAQIALEQEWQNEV